MTILKRNEPIKLELSLEHLNASLIAAALVTEAEHHTDEGSVTVSLQSPNFSDLRARWNTVMRALIASEQSLEVTKGWHDVR
tara:strand:+ start:866 stop:1111 length:246 start_codon:yes stop_codon:yes gene_type:complete